MSCQLLADHDATLVSTVLGSCLNPLAVADEEDKKPDEMVGVFGWALLVAAVQRVLHVSVFQFDRGQETSTQCHWSWARH